MANQYLLALISGRDLHLRAADADRERIAERLRRAHAEGRLDITEFQERLERCYAAKTFGDLSELVGDLPRPDDRPERSWLDWLRASRWILRMPLVSLLVAFILISAATGDDHHIFWVWALAAFLIWRMSSWRRRWHTQARRGPGGWI
jgi:Domain of unknown function (DUF1707)